MGESGVHLSFNKRILIEVNQTKKLIIRKNIGANIVILKLFPGIKEQVVKCILDIKDLQGVILETYGAGNAPTSKWFIDLLQKTIRKKIPIVNVSQCISGSVDLGHYETSRQLKQIGLIDGKDITTESAVAKLVYLIGIGIQNADFKKVFETPLRGEME